MSTQFRNNKIEALEPSKLSQSIKSRGEDQKMPTNISYQTYFAKKINPALQSDQQLSKKTITQTQQIYGTQQTDQKFKKTKNYQVDKLNELKKQYEILRNIKIDDSFIYEQKISKKQQSSGQVSQKSIHSIKSVHTNSKHKNQNLVQYQKKQLQLMLANSMYRIQQLLKAEVQYKRKIYELNSLRPNSQNTNQKYEQKLRNLQSSQKNNKEVLEKMKFQQQRLRKVNYNLTQRIRSIQSQNFNYQTELRRNGQQKKRLQQTILLQKEGHMTTKIQVKRFQLERDMIERQKNIEIERLRKNIKDLQAQIQRLNGKFKQKQQQISQLNQKLKEINIQLTKAQVRNSEQKDRNKQRQKQIQRQLQRQKQKKILIQKQKQNVQNSEYLQKRLQQKMKQLQRYQDQKVKREIGILKQQIDKMKYQHDNSADQIHLQIRIAALQKIITEDNQEKAHFLDQLRRIIKDFEELQIQNQDLKQKLRKAYHQIEILKQSSVLQLERLQKNQQQVKSSLNIEQVNNYLTKIRRLQVENKQLKTKITKFQENNFSKESRTQQKIREYSKRIQQAEFQNERLLKQNQFNLQIANSKYKAEIEIAKNDTARGIKEKNQQKAKSQQMKNALQLKLSNLKNQQQQYIKMSNQKNKNKDRQIQQLRKYSENMKAKVRQQYQRQFFALLARLDELIKSNQRYVIENSRLISSEGQLYELRQRIRKMAGLSDCIDHLWQIKETEYYNINQILKQFKPQ